MSQHNNCYAWIRNNPLPPPQPHPLKKKKKKKKISQRFTETCTILHLNADTGAT